MEEKYFGGVIPDGEVGHYIRHLVIEPPVDPEDIGDLESATDTHHVTSERGWSRFVIAHSDPRDGDEIFGDTQAVFVRKGLSLEKSDKIDDTTTRENFFRQLARKGMKYD